MTKTLMQAEQKVFETGCCPRFDAALMDEHEFTWQDKRFVRGHVISFAHMPLNFGRVMTRLQKRIAQAGGKIQGGLILSSEKSSWGTDVFVAVDKEIPEMEMQYISGTFLVRVFEGEFREMQTFIVKMRDYLAEKRKQSSRWFFFYPYCPKCAKAYGTNYVAIFAQIV